MVTNVRMYTGHDRLLGSVFEVTRYSFGEKF
jgi:hypothetical protein